MMSDANASSRATEPDDVTLARLQRMLLDAVIAGRPLPGLGHPLALADMTFFPRGRPIRVADENLARGVTARDPASAAGPGDAFEVVSTEMLRQEASAGEDVPYLHFQSPRPSGDAIGLTLEARLASGGEGGPELGLSAIAVEFREVDGEWRVVGEPSALAS